VVVVVVEVDVVVVVDVVDPVTADDGIPDKNLKNLLSSPQHSLDPKMDLNSVHVLLYGGGNVVELVEVEDVEEVEVEDVEVEEVEVVVV